MNLVIVESPTKARKLGSYLDKSFVIKASVGHVRDLPKNTLGVDVDKDFEPIYVVDPDKEKVMAELQKYAKTCDTIYLATDPDREGEAIAWHVKEILKAKSQDSKSNSKKRQQSTAHNPKFLRATFHEITKQAVMHAIEHPSKLNMDLVDAQQARRVVDRLVGYKLSPVLWKKVRRGLSAGRVQSVALRLIAEREREIEAFKPDEYWEVDVLLNAELKVKSLKLKEVYKIKKDSGNVVFEDYPNEMFVARVTEIDGGKYEPKSEKDVTGVVENLQSAQYVITAIDRKERRRSSLPPFTTSTLQQASANRLGYTSKQTMRLAQQLYEEGLITYHRTDSVSLSQQAIDMGRQHIQSQFGDAYLTKTPRIFANKSKNAQEAHESIRPTDTKITEHQVSNVSGKFTAQHEKLYDLIWRRFLATQMSEAVYDSTTVFIEAFNSKKYTLKATGSVLKFDGWMKLFPNKGDQLLPSMETKQSLGFVDLNAQQKFTQPPPRYNDASLVKTLEEKGIGRPSTYSSIISVIVDRGYVERMDKRFVATAVGLTVNDFLVTNFPDILDYDFTAEMEEDLDRIARGEKEWQKIIKAFYTPFEKKVELVTEKSERVQVPVEKTGESCPLCGKEEKGEIVIRSGRFGKFKSCSRFPECKFTENIVETVEGMHCPLCQQGDVIVKNSRWGKSFFGCSLYPDCDWASWKKPEIGYKVTKEEWAIMQQERKERIAKRQAGKTSSAKAKPSKTVKKKVVKKRKTKKSS